MKSTLIPLSLAVAVALPVVAHAQQKPDELLKKHGCTACHQIDKKVVGPAYNDVAAKYKGDAKAATTLMDSVKKGSVKKWGEIPMPPNVNVPDADIKSMVTYILSLKK